MDLLRIQYSQFLRFDILPKESLYFFIGYFFVTIKFYCHLLDAEMYGIVKHRPLLTPNAYLAMLAKAKLISWRCLSLRQNFFVSNIAK